ncbi:hypothetical protein FHL15_007227 [Xylaria flabelliformis]|uniref:Uncharacterized protein n=1 Tax=Xylaria flabelliformis TaxID=2512241 RepID=A0A553HVB7_9PEZI|nr:hypothetical protein FHL15_007227 [Xylaria flabelliformis]
MNRTEQESGRGRSSETLHSSVECVYDTVTTPGRSDTSIWRSPATRMRNMASCTARGNSETCPGLASMTAQDVRAIERASLPLEVRPTLQYVFTLLASRMLNLLSDATSNSMETADYYQSGGIKM